MSAALNKQLIDSEGQAAPRSHRRFVVASAAAIAGLLLSASFVGYHVSKSSAKSVNVATVNDDLFGNYSQLGELSATDSCYSYLGSKCEGISDKRCTDYKALCVENECACRDACAGGDGTCYNDKNRKLNKQPLWITNHAYSNWYLYLPSVTLGKVGRVMHDLSANKTNKTGKLGRGHRYMLRVARWWTRWFTPYGRGHRFNLYKLPGRRYNGHHLFYLTAERYPTWVATIQHSRGDYGMYGVNMDIGKPHKDPQGIAVQVCSMEKAAAVNAVKIGRTFQNGHDVWARLPDNSLSVVGWDTKATDEESGSNSYWVLSEPEILKELEDCEA